MLQSRGAEASQTNRFIHTFYSRFPISTQHRFQSDSKVVGPEAEHEALGVCVATTPRTETMRLALENRS